MDSTHGRSAAPPECARSSSLPVPSRAGQPRTKPLLIKARPTLAHRMALDYVTRWQWPVMVGALPPSNANGGGLGAMGGVLEPTTDPDRVRDWWSQWPEAGIVVPVGNGFEVLTVPLPVGQAALEVLTERGSWLGPVMSDEDTISMLVRSGQTERWIELVAKSGAGYAYAGQGQLVVLPPGSAHVRDAVRWVVPPTSANALQLPGFQELGQLVARPPARPRRWLR